MAWVESRVRQERRGVQEPPKVGQPAFHPRHPPNTIPANLTPLKTNQRLNDKVTTHGFCACGTLPRYYDTSGRAGLCPAFHFSCMHQSTCELRGNPAVGADGLRTHLLILKLVLDEGYVLRTRSRAGYNRRSRSSLRFGVRSGFPVINAIAFIISDRLVSASAAAGIKSCLVWWCAGGDAVLVSLCTTQHRRVQQSRAGRRYYVDEHLSAGGNITRS